MAGKISWEVEGGVGKERTAGVTRERSLGRVVERQEALKSVAVAPVWTGGWEGSEPHV